MADMTPNEPKSANDYDERTTAAVKAVQIASGQMICEQSHGININVVHGWRKAVRGARAVAISRQQEFMPIQLEPWAAQPVPARLHPWQGQDD